MNPSFSLEIPLQNPDRSGLFQAYYSSWLNCSVFPPGLVSTCSNKLGDIMDPGFNIEEVHVPAEVEKIALRYARYIDI